MANSNFSRCLSATLKWEGGYADHPADPGGATKYGITRATLTAWRGRTVSKTDVRRLTREEAAEIYKARYWDVVRAGELPAGVDYCVFDAVVNSGPARAAKWLQAATRVRQDGVIGPITLAAVRGVDGRQVIEDLCDVRLAFLRGLSGWAVFGRGWERRVGDVRRVARELAAAVGADAANLPPVPAQPDLRTSEPGSAPERRVWSALAAFLRAMLTGGRS